MRKKDIWCVAFICEYFCEKNYFNTKKSPSVAFLLLQLYDKIRKSEQKYKVALEVLSYHNQCGEEEFSRQISLPMPAGQQVGGKCTILYTTLVGMVRTPPPTVQAVIKLFVCFFITLLSIDYCLWMVEYFHTFIFYLYTIFFADTIILDGCFPYCAKEVTAKVWGGEVKK